MPQNIIHIRLLERLDRLQIGDCFIQSRLAMLGVLHGLDQSRHQHVFDYGEATAFNQLLCVADKLVIRFVANVSCSMLIPETSLKCVIIRQDEQW